MRRSQKSSGKLFGMPHWKAELSIGISAQQLLTLCYCMIAKASIDIPVTGSPVGLGGLKDARGLDDDKFLSPIEPTA